MATGETVESKQQAPVVQGFFETLRAANPAGAKLLEDNAEKAALASSLRARRRAVGLSREELSCRATMDLTLIDRMEAPTGALHDPSDIRCYLEALGPDLG